MALFESVIQDFRKEFPDLVPMASGFGAIDVVLPGVDKALGIKEEFYLSWRQAIKSLE